MSTPQSDGDEAAFDARLDEKRADGDVHRPRQTAATESVEESVDEQRRAVTSEDD